MKNRFPFFVAGGITILFLLCIAGCGKTVLSGSGPCEGEDTSTGARLPQISQNPVSGNPRWYVSPAGNNSEYGDDPSRPMASVGAALARIKSAYRSGRWPAGKSAVIVINGTITAGSGSLGSNQAMIDISGSGNYPPVILEGDPANKGVLHANRSKTAEGRVLYIANNTVTLGNNLTLTGGYSLWGGAVCVGTQGVNSYGEFIMAGGEISGNTASLGGGVLLYNGAMTMTGGEIKSNATIDNSGSVMRTGGGVYVGEDTVFTMTGGTISGNGGSGTVDGGGVAIQGKGAFTMSGGTISHNKSTVCGGGVHIAPYGKFTMTAGTISDNASGASGGVYVPPQNGTFKKTGGTVIRNTP